MGWQPGRGHGAGEEPGADSDQPGATGTPEAARDPRLAGFAKGGEWDTCAPGPELADVLAEVAGPQWRCPGATDDELTGVLRRLAALESWTAAARLGVIRELIRRDDVPLPGRPRHGDLPDEWSDSLNHELALALASSVQSAEATALTAWELGARLPRIAALLAEGILSYSKAKLIVETFQWLSDDDAARAEALLLPQLTGTAAKTFGQLVNLTARIAAQVDPGLAERRRKAAVKHGSRVQMFRENSGAAALSGRDLPPDETLAANANVNARALQYKESGAFGDAQMDQLRATGYLDLLNQVSAADRIALGRLATDPDEDDPPGNNGSPGDTDPPGNGSPGNGSPGTGSPGTRNNSPGNGSSGSGGAPAPRLPRLTDLTLPLVTLLGLAERPGEGHGLGTLDPDLCRRLAATAVNSPRTELCVMVTDPDGIAIGHGCGRHRRGQAARTGASDTTARLPRTAQVAALPARLNLTITETALRELAAGNGRGRPAAWSFTRLGDYWPPGDGGPPDGYGSWLFTAPGGRRFTVRLEPLPTFGCDHRYESHGYEPSDKLRHLVQIRDYQCTFPSCSRHARESDFEHARPYQKGGRTCGCNAGARSRKCHRVKQSPGWRVTQPRPGWHQWETPSGRVYTQGPYRYPV